MEQEQRLNQLIAMLLAEEKDYEEIQIPADFTSKQKLFRALVNVRPPKAVSQKFLQLQDAYLQEETRKKQIVSLDELEWYTPQIALWKGDITRLQADGIVNAANSAMLGCFAPNHGCIDNVINTYAGVQLRLYMNEIMQKQGHYEETGLAKISPAYNLPSRFVLHTVGPIIYGPLKHKDKQLLKSCYESCLSLADENHLESIAFCCISTGEFHFPNREAAKIAVKTTEDYLKKTGSKLKVIFNVFKDLDERLYQEELAKYVR
jgi:O-acetyl-ADP-ribose deacetylase (regulator of RNase III)